MSDPTSHPSVGHPTRRRLARIAALLAIAAAAVFGVRSVRSPAVPEPAVADESVEALPLDAGAGAGELTPDDAPAQGGRVLDAWTFSTDTDEPVTFRVAAAFAPALVVRAPDGSLHEAKPDSADAHVAILDGLRGKGTYRLSVSSRAAGGRGRYTVVVWQDPIPLELVPDGMPSPGELGARGRAGRDGRYADRFAFEARSGQPYLVVQDADSLFAHVVVRSPEGDSLAGVVYERLRTARGGYASVARFTPRYAGRYTVDVVSNRPGAIGHYMLALKTRPQQVAIRRATVRGVLGLVSQLRGSRYVDTFTFEAVGGRPVAFEVRPAGFTLALLNAAGDTLDAGPRVGAIMPKDGRYRVAVTSVAPRGTGSYDLVPAIPPVPPAADTTEGE